MTIILDVKVVPASGRQKCILDKSEQIKCYLKNQAESGKANAELIETFSKFLKIPKDSITILLGATSRKKRLRLETELSMEQVLKYLGIEKQLKIS